LNITEQFKHIFEPELLKEFEEKAKHISAKEGDIILDNWTNGSFYTNSPFRHFENFKIG